MKNFPEVAIIILTWNGKKLLQKFLPSVAEIDYPNYNIYIIDNNSSDDTETFIKQTFPEVKYVKFPKNYGFAKGNNEALKLLQDEELLLLLNNDVKVEPNLLTELTKYFQLNPDVGVAQPKILSYNEPNKFEYAGAAGGLIDKLAYPLCRGRILNKTEEDKDQYKTSKNIFWASGACLLIRRNIVNKIGLFDEDFWAHMEEIDLCWRTQRLGYKIACVAETKVFHLGGGSLNYGNPKKLFLNYRNNLFMLIKNLPAPQFYIIFLRLIVDGASAIFFAMKEKSIVPVIVVLKAHFAFYKNIPRMLKKRKTLKLKFLPLGKLNGVIKSLAIWEYLKK